MIHFSVKVIAGAKCNFSYAKVGLYRTRKTQTNDAGYVDIDWFRVEPVE